MTVPAVQLYTVREAVAVDRSAALARLAEIGFREVELYDFVGDPEGYRRDLDAAGLTAISGHAHLVAADPEPALAAADILGLSFLIEPAVPRDRWQTRDSIAQTADALARAAALAPAGLRIGYHNHAWEIETLIDGGPALDTFVAHLDDAVVLEVDAYWVEAAGEPAAGYLRRLGHRVGLVHVKDGMGTADVLDQVAVGTGTLDIDGVLEATANAIRILELDAYRGDPFDALAQGLDYVARRS